MNLLTTILLLIAGIIVLVLIVAAFTKKGYSISREIVINTSSQKAFDYLRYLRNWDHFNRDAMAEPDKKKEFKGTDGTPGFIYAWSGNSKAGEGEKEIIHIEEGKKIATQIRFVKPFKVTGDTCMTTEALSPGHTKITFSNASRLFYPLNFMLLFIEKNIAKGMDENLNNLKTILEKNES